MPSSSKTANLQLNKWLGSDKPKKDDFNSDNQVVDTAYAALQSSINGVSQSLSSHSSNLQIHITSAERTAWNANDKSTIGTYQGDGTASRKITIGFQARFGIIYSAGNPLQIVDLAAMNCTTYSGIFGSSGCTEGITADATGFTVINHLTMRPNGNTIRLNEPGAVYIYIAWK